MGHDDLFLGEKFRRQLMNFAILEFQATSDVDLKGITKVSPFDDFCKADTMGKPW